MNRLKKIMYNAMAFLPSDPKMILFESPDFGDNSAELYNYLISKETAYKVVWLVENTKECKQKNPSINFISRKSFLYNFYYRWRSAYCFYSHHFVGVPYKPGQKRCFLTHGIPLKDSRNCFWDPYYNSEIICTSDEAAELRCKTFGGGNDIVKVLGFPRNDILLRTNDVRSNLGISQDSKIIVWMPTFKHHSHNNKRSDMAEEKDNDISLLTYSFMERVNAFLEQNDCYLIIKFHPYQDKAYVKNIQFSNIKSFDNNDLSRMVVSVYQLLAISDSLITDFSSVYFDYLICNKPIGFDLTDYNNYSRGFLVSNPLDYMPGDKITSEDEFIAFCNDVIKEKDKWVKERASLINRMHKYVDSNSAKRILDYYKLI